MVRIGNLLIAYGMQGNLLVYTRYAIEDILLVNCTTVIKPYNKMKIRSECLSKEEDLFLLLLKFDKFAFKELLILVWIYSPEWLIVHKTNLYILF